jgi:hypothetical protein
VIGIEVFGPYKYLLMNDEVVNTVIKQCHMIMDGVNNLSRILQKVMRRLVVGKILNKIRTITKGMHVGMMM